MFPHSFCILHYVDLGTNLIAQATGSRGVFRGVYISLIGLYGWRGRYCAQPYLLVPA